MCTECQISLLLITVCSWVNLRPLSKLCCSRGWGDMFTEFNWGMKSEALDFQESVECSRFILNEVNNFLRWGFCADEISVWCNVRGNPQICRAEQCETPWNWMRHWACNLTVTETATCVFTFAAGEEWKLWIAEHFTVNTIIMCYFLAIVFFNMYEFIVTKVKTFTIGKCNSISTSSIFWLRGFHWCIMIQYSFKIYSLVSLETDILHTITMLSVYFSTYDFVSYFYCYAAAAAMCVSQNFFMCKLWSLCSLHLLLLLKVYKTVADICQPSFHSSPSLAVVNVATSLLYTFLQTLQPIVRVPWSLPVWHCFMILPSL
jgi:hypothetical protein